MGPQTGLEVLEKNRGLRASLVLVKNGPQSLYGGFEENGASELVWRFWRKLGASELVWWF